MNFSNALLRNIAHTANCAKLLFRGRQTIYIAYHEHVMYVWFA